MRTSDLIMKDNPIVQHNGGNDDEEEEGTVEVLVSIPDRRVKKLYHFDKHDKVWTAKLLVISELMKGAKDGLNYAFYDPPYNGKSGKFLEEERLFIDYPLNGSPPILEFKRKGRIYRSMGYDPKTLQKVNSKPKQKKFIELVSGNQINRVVEMTGEGIDPNFQDEKTGETPLSVAASKEDSRVMITTLVSGGAQLDYRTREGLTPLHKAAVCGQANSVKILLDFGASPNYKDSRGLTPLFHTVLNGGDPYCCEILLNDHSEVHIADHQGMQEIHLACKNGLVQHLEHLLFYGAEINARTASGNTALHVAALNNQDACARVLLFRGAKKDILNYANQSAYEVAAVSGNKGLAELIANFTERDIVKLSAKPTYSTRRRKSVSKPKVSSIFTRSTSESQLSTNSDVTPPSPGSSTYSFPSVTDFDEQNSVMNGEIEMANNKRTFSMSSTASDSSESDSGELSPREIKHNKRWPQFSGPDEMARTIVPPVKTVPGGATIRKRLYASKPGKTFVAIRDYRPFMAGELALEKGDEVEVLYVGEKGYWEGRVGNSTGWFHHSYVEEKKKADKPKLFGRPTSGLWPSKSDTNGVNHMGLNNIPDPPRLVTLQRSAAGYGFQMRGANSQVPRLNFEPTPEFPALQYFGELEKGGQAEMKGIRTGDFILEVNGEDVTAATHGHVVDLIKKSGESVTLKIVTVTKETSPSINGTDHVDGQGFRHPPPPPDRDPSTTLTLGRMSRLSSSRPSLYEMSMGDSSYEDPASYRVDSVITVSKENRWYTLQRQKPHSRRPVGVQLKAQNINKLRGKSTTDLSTGNAAFGERAHSMQSVVPPTYDSVSNKRPVSTVIPVATPHVPGEFRIPRSTSIDNSYLSKHPSTYKSTPNLDKTVNHADGMIGYGSHPHEADRSMAYNRPFSYVGPDSPVTSGNELQTVVATVVGADSSESKSELTVVATPVEVFETGTGAQKSAPRSPEKPPVPRKPPSLSDALQEAVAARAERMSQQSSDTEMEPVQRSRKNSAPDSVDSSFRLTERKERRSSAPTKVNPRKKLEASEKVRTEIMSSLEETFIEEESGFKSPLKNGRFDFDTRSPKKPISDSEKTLINSQTASSSSKVERNDSEKDGPGLASSNVVYSRSTNPTSQTRDMNRQFSLDSSEAKRQTTLIKSDKLERQMSEPVSIERIVSSNAVPAAPTPPPPPPSQIQLSARASSTSSPVPPPPPVTLPNTAKKDIPGTPATTGLITTDALAASKLKLKSPVKDDSNVSKAESPVRKHPAPAGPSDSRHLADEHSNLLAKAIAARAARISAQPHSDTDLSVTSSTLQRVNKAGVERRPSSPEKTLNQGLNLEARGVNSRGKPSPPVAPKKRFTSPDLRHSAHGRDTGRSVPFDVPAPVLSEEDRTVMLLDEVIRKEAESENWSLNSWNSGSDSSSDVFVPPAPVWPADHQEKVENASPKAWYESSSQSQSEESIPKASETEKFNKTITTKKGFKIQLTFETKKPAESPNPTRTSPQTDYNDIDPIEPVKINITDSTARKGTPENVPLKKEGNVQETDTVSNTVVLVNSDNGDNSFGLPPPLSFTDADEPYTALDSPPLPPPPEFSPREPKVSLNSPEEDNAGSTPSSARSDDSDKGAVGYTDISSIFSGYAKPKEPQMEKALLDWDCSDVCNWLDSIQMSQYKETFIENDIQGIHLPDLKKSELKELGVKSLGHRMTLENAIAKLSQPLESNC